MAGPSGKTLRHAHGKMTASKAGVSGMRYIGHVENGTIVLNQPVALPEGATVEVEVAVKAADSEAGDSSGILDLVSALPGGSRTKEDIDRQMHDERTSWGEA